MINIPKHKLEKFGYSIRCNRKRKLNLTKAAKWTQSRFCEGICSQTSLISMEKGNAGRFIENYPKLAERLDLQVAYSDEIDKRIPVYTDHIYTAIEFYEFDKMRKYFDKLYELLDSVKNCLWYCDLYEAAKAVDNYYLKRQFLNFDDRNYIADMVGEFSNEWDEMIKAVIYISAYQNVDSTEYITRYKELKIEKCKSAFNKINIMLYYLDISRTLKLLNIAVKYEKEWIKSNNYLRILDNYGIKLPYLSIHDSYEVERIYKRIKDIIATHDVPRYKIAECYFGAAIAYCNLKRYKKSLEACEICYEYDDRNALPIFLYFAHAQRMMKNKVKMPKYNDEEIANFSIIYQRFYEYFHIVNESVNEGEKYIQSRIVSIVDADYDRNLLKLIGEELGLIADVNNHYSIVTKFNAKINGEPEENEEEDILEDDELVD